MAAFLSLLSLALAVFAASITVSKTEVFRPLRERVPAGMARELVNCPYCLAHWFAAPPAILQTAAVYDFLFVWLSVIGLCALMIAVYMRLWGFHELEAAKLRQMIREQSMVIRDLKDVIADASI